MPEVSSLANGEKRSSERVVLVGERPLAQAVKSFEHADPITLPCISPESRFDPGNVIGWLKKRFLKGLLLVKCAMILAKPVLPLKETPSHKHASILYCWQSSGKVWGSDMFSPQCIESQTAPRTVGKAL